ncbi:lipocalin-like domain-containing protein [Gaetbulibacter saemankumensis]|uniref:lipocalin family protein n=1 Tax=Gaetbulibacter saemankumensis TaxID=311208 RepID=UPI00048A1E91|nr:lipocalin family protein [Gaetbulibacter saemankumensis]
MKKLSIILLTFLIVACSSDNNETVSIVGIWKPIAEVQVCSTGSRETYPYDACEQKSRVTFASNGMLNITDFDDYTGDCLEDYNENGTWTLNGGDLSVNIDGETLNPTFFELSDNTLRIGYYDNDENDPCDGGKLPSHCYTEYTRVD